MASNSGQKFVGKNRAPRVQVEYDVELYGAEKKVNLPFVMGVVSDLSGKPAEPLPKLEDRKMLEIDADNFDDRLKSVKPRVALNVPNVMSGEGNLSVEMTFESMDDFSPAAVAQKVDGLKQLLQARQELANLLSYMDGKSGAEELLNKILEDPALLKALSQKAKEKAPAEDKAEDAPAK
ncbi:MAG: type VI secretion system contractile sheath small subunit [Alphaproteobacteria bacterium]|jgi:type VI secretion system protein ImpB